MAVDIGGKMFLTPQDVADRLGVSRDSVLRWIRNKELRAMKSPKRLLVLEGDLLAFLENRATK